MTKYAVEMITRSIDAYNKTIRFDILTTNDFRVITNTDIEGLKDLKSEIDRILIHYNERMLKW